MRSPPPKKSSAYITAAEMKEEMTSPAEDRRLEADGSLKHLKIYPKKRYVSLRESPGLENRDS